jgi:hypothetical protein
MRWEIVGRRRDEQDDGIEWVWILQRGEQIRHVRVIDARDGFGRELIEALLDTDQPPEILTFPVSFSEGDVVEYVGDFVAGEEGAEVGDETPKPGERGTIVDVNEFNGDVIVSWESCSALVHGYADVDLRQVQREPGSG